MGSDYRFRVRAAWRAGRGGGGVQMGVAQGEAQQGDERDTASLAASDAGRGALVGPPHSQLNLFSKK